MEDKYSFLKENNIHSFEDWSKKSFDEKLSILLKLDAIPDNFSHFEKNYLDTLKEQTEKDFSKDSDRIMQEVDKNFDFFMRVIKFPQYKEKFKSSYPEELLNLNFELVSFLKKSGNDSNYLLSPIDALKKNGVSNLSEWYKKSIDEKRKILMSSDDFMGVDVEVKKGKIPLILQYGKERYTKYLDQCFYSTIYRISEVLNWENTDDVINSEKLLDEARLNLEKRIEERFMQKVAESKEIIEKNREKIIADMHNNINSELSNLNEEDRKEIKNYLESII